jgi:hypothetical protein
MHANLSLLPPPSSRVWDSMMAIEVSLPFHKQGIMEECHRIGANLTTFPPFLRRISATAAGKQCLCPRREFAETEAVLRTSHVCLNQRLILSRNSGGGGGPGRQTTSGHARAGERHPPVHCAFSLIDPAAQRQIQAAPAYRVKVHATRDRVDDFPKLHLPRSDPVIRPVAERLVVKQRSAPSLSEPPRLKTPP